MKKSEIPQFGVLNGVNAVVVGTNVAAPMAGHFFGGLGANVTLVEMNQFCLDPGRDYPAMYYHKKHRNNRSLVCDWSTPEGKEVFLKLMADNDILVESSKGGQMDRWGLSDDVLWAANPKLSIVHVSGYGQTGLPNYVKRGGYDAIAQAFGGIMYLNGEADGDPMPCNPYIADQLTANMCTWSGLAGYINAQKTGKGESFDIAAYEVCLANQAYYENAWNFGKRNERMGSKNFIAGWGIYNCTDGQIYSTPIGASFKFKGVPYLGLNAEELGLVGTKSYLVDGVDAGAPVIIQALKDFCKDKTVMECDQLLNDHGIACSPITNYDNARSNPHMIAREDIITINDNGREFYTTNIFPKTKNYPNHIWRAAPTAGKDNEDILEELGYSAEEIEKLYGSEVLFRRDDPDYGFYPPTLAKEDYASFKSDATNEDPESYKAIRKIK